MSLISDIKEIQRLCKVRPDGVMGPVTAAAVLRELSGTAATMAAGDVNARTLKAIATLDVKARDAFLKFSRLAAATAATFGCEYTAICGTRSMETQAHLKAVSDAGGPHAAAPGFSWHNFGVAVDYGVFQPGGKVYLDKTSPALADQVHAACAVHATACGLEWGGTWKGKSCDPPHYQIYMGHSIPTAADRAAYRTEGTVL